MKLIELLRPLHDRWLSSLLSPVLFFGNPFNKPKTPESMGPEQMMALAREEQAFNEKMYGKTLKDMRRNEYIQGFGSGTWDKKGNFQQRFNPRLLRQLGQERSIGEKGRGALLGTKIGETELNTAGLKGFGSLVHDPAKIQEAAFGQMKSLDAPYAAQRKQDQMREILQAGGDPYGSEMGTNALMQHGDAEARRDTQMMLDSYGLGTQMGDYDLAQAGYADDQRAQDLNERYRTADFEYGRAGEMAGSTPPVGPQGYSGSFSAPGAPEGADLTGAASSGQADAWKRYGGKMDKYNEMMSQWSNAAGSAAAGGKL